MIEVMKAEISDLVLLLILGLILGYWGLILGYWGLRAKDD